MRARARGDGGRSQPAAAAAAQPARAARALGAPPAHSREHRPRPQGRGAQGPARSGSLGAFRDAPLLLLRHRPSRPEASSLCRAAQDRAQPPHPSQAQCPCARPAGLPVLGGRTPRRRRGGGSGLDSRAGHVMVRQCPSGRGEASAGRGRAPARNSFSAGRASPSALRAAQRGRLRAPGAARRGGCPCWTRPPCGPAGARRRVGGLEHRLGVT